MADACGRPASPAAAAHFPSTCPVYSLARLLAPVVTEKGRLRTSFVLVRAELKPSNTPPRGNWKEVCQHALEVIRNCVYVDKDLVLPPMASGFTDTIYVVASTDMLRVGIMLHRIEEQMKAVEQLGKSGTLKLSAEPLEGIAASPVQTLEQQIQAVAKCVHETILGRMAGAHEDCGPGQGQGSFRRYPLRGRKSSAWSNLAYKNVRTYPLSICISIGLPGKMFVLFYVKNAGCRIVYENGFVSHHERGFTWTNSLRRHRRGEECRGPSTPQELHFVKFLLRSG